MAGPLHRGATVLQRNVTFHNRPATAVAYSRRCLGAQLAPAGIITAARKDCSALINNRLRRHLTAVLRAKTKLHASQGVSYDSLASYDDPWSPAARVYEPGIRAKQQTTTEQQRDKDATSSTSEADAGAAPQLMAHSKQFLLQRFVVFASIFVGYSAYYVTRNSLTYAAPLMIADPALQLDITQIGALTSLFPIAYGTSKFVSGVLSARFSPSVLLAVGLMATALINVAFGFSSSLLWFSMLWFANGVLQGVGGPTCATIVTNWYSQKERGTWWALWSAAHNFGGAVAPLIIGWAANSFGWRWGMFAPGVVGLAVGAVILMTAKDRPQDCGFPAVEGKPAAAALATSSTTASGKDGSGMVQVAQAAAGAAHLTSKGRALATSRDAPAAAAPVEGPKAEQHGMKEQLVTVLRNPFVWLLAFTYFFIYVVRQGVLSWFVFYLVAEKGAPNAASAAMTMSAVELGGLVGGTLAGVLSDWYIKLAPGDGGSVGKRVQIVVIYTVATMAALLFFRAAPASMGWLAVFLVGFTIYGPQMLIGLCGAELVAPAAVGTSQGLLGWIAYLGAANAGIPLSWIVKNHGWDAYFDTLVGSCGAALLLLLPMLGAKSFMERQALQAPRRPSFA